MLAALDQAEAMLLPAMRGKKSYSTTLPAK
jgi:hypothetical protein